LKWYEFFLFLNLKDTDISRLADAFKIQAELTLEELQKLIRNTLVSSNSDKLDNEELIQIIATCATFIGEELWTNPNLNEKAIGN